MDRQEIAAALSRKGYSVRTALVAKTILVLVPALLLGGWFVFNSAAHERASIERDAEQRARGITALIDHEIANRRGVLTALANSHNLEAGNLEAFYRKAIAVSRDLGIQFVLRDPKLDQQLVNTAVPWNAAKSFGALPERREAEQQALRSGQAFVSNVFFGRLTKQYIVSVVVPVTRKGVIVYFLAAGIETKKFAEILRNSQLPSSWVATIVDRNNVIVARSSGHDEHTGTKLRNEFVSIALPSGGVFTGTSRENILTQWTYRRSEASGWFISVAVPASVLAAPAQQALTRFALAGGLLLVGGIGLSYWLGGRLSQSMGALGIDRKPTRKEFEVLFESAPNGVLVVDGNGQIALVNAQMQAMFGYARDEFIGQSIEMLIPERFRSGHSDLRRAFARAPSSRPMGAGRELFGLRKDGSDFPIEIGLNPISTKAGNLVMATVVDISARKLAEQQLLASAEALRTSEVQRSLAVEAAELATWTWDIANNEIWWSDRLRHFLGVPPTMEATHENFFERIHPSDRHLVVGNTDRCASGQPHFDHDYRIVTLDGDTTRWVNSRGRIDYDESGKLIRMHGAIQDITDRKAAEQMEHDLRRRLMQGQEYERLRLAHELHDQTGQSLVAVMMELKDIETTFNDAGRHRLTLLRKKLEQMGQALHHVAWELRPASIDDLGLATALGNYISEWGSQFGIEVDFHCRDRRVDELTEEVHTTVYRLVQETLTNIAKHAAGATSVSVLIDRVEALLWLTIEDNGVGFDPAALDAPGNRRLGGLGIAGMRERLALIGGDFEIESSVGSGSTIYARIPLQQNRMTA